MTNPDPRLDRTNLREDAEQWTSRSSNGVVACAHYLAADAGAQVLAAGGNAADAAIGAALALNVCEPAASGLGGMTMIVGHGFAEQPPFFLDGACTAPAAATPELVGAAHRYRGYRSVAIPGAAAAWASMHQRFGRLPLAEIVQPAIALARRGSTITPLQHELAHTYKKALLAGNCPHLGLDAAGNPHAIGTVVPQPRLAETLERLAKHGLMSMYHGEIAAEIADDMRQGDGFLTADDLSAVTEPTPRAPIAVNFRDRRLFTAGPPAGGIALAQLAMMCNSLDADLDPRQPRDLVLIAEMIRRVRQDRRHTRLDIGARELGMAGSLLSARNAQTAMQEVQAAADGGAGETSHLCAMDQDGGCISMTMSIERSFGSARMPQNLGFLYNGYLRGFKIQNKRHPHFLTPGAPARSNAAPTILIDGPKTIAIGSTGSERMISGIFTTLLRLQHQDEFDAVLAPRIHCSPEGDLLAEIGRISPDCADALNSRYNVTNADPYAFKFGGLQLTTSQNGQFVGVGEPRRDGGAASPAQA
tara:strand:+ start:5898 stop:7490 length:1593 start_codon:yes stop_codon:yes gene_type:complete